MEQTSDYISGKHPYEERNTMYTHVGEAKVENRLEPIYTTDDGHTITLQTINQIVNDKPTRTRPR